MATHKRSSDDETHDENLKINILEAIDYIRNTKRKRPTTEGIFNFIKESLTELSIEEYKKCFDILIEEGILEVTGEGSNESVFIKKKKERGSDAHKSMSDNEKTLSDSLNFIDKKYSEIVSNKTKNDTISELKDFIRDEIKRGIITMDSLDLSNASYENVNIQYDNNKDKFMEILKGKDSIIKVLQDQINFLQEQNNILIKRQNHCCISCNILDRELTSKQKIIDTIIDDNKKIVENDNLLRNTDNKNNSQMNLLNTSNFDKSDKIKETNKTVPGNNTNGNKTKFGKNKNKTNDNKSQSEKREKNDSNDYERNITNKKKKDTSSDNNDNDNHNKKVTCIIGDSMLKNMKGWILNKKLNKDFIVVKSFPGATTECIEDYIKPTLRKKPDRLILHVGTNNLKSSDTPSKISKSIISLAKLCSESGCEVIVSGLITRGDELQGKVEALNSILQKSCGERNIGYIDHGNITINDLNGSKIHLNKRGANKLDKNIIEFIKKC